MESGAGILLPSMASIEWTPLTSPPLGFSSVLPERVPGFLE
ncbi:hypothetical protein LINGRAHAP2_LOCUS23221 [Linum grandiflorum]